MNLQQIIKDPTRVTDTSSTLDHVIVNNAERICQSGVLPLGLSDHMVTYCSRTVIRRGISTHRTIRIRFLEHYTSDKLNQILASFDWTDIMNCTNVDYAWLL